MIGCLVFMLFLAVGVVLAQQSAAPAPAPSTPAAPATAPATPTAAPAPAASAPAAAKAAAPVPSLTISRMEIAGSVEDRQPVGIAATFPASQEKVFCYVELKDVPKDTTITFAWTFGQNETDKVTQQIKKSARWRTWGNKSLAGRIGDWKVDVLDESGTVLKSATFKVE